MEKKCIVNTIKHEIFQKEYDKLLSLEKNNFHWKSQTLKHICYGQKKQSFWRFIY